MAWIDRAQIEHRVPIDHPADDGDVEGTQRIEVISSQLDPDARDGDRRERAATRHGFGLDDLRDRLRSRHTCDKGLGPRRQLLDGCCRHSPEGDGLTISAEVRKRRFLQCAKNQATGANRSSQRVSGTAPNQLGAAGDDSRLWPAQEFVTAEHHEVRPGSERLSGCRFTSQPRWGRPIEPRTSGVEQSRPDVGHDRNVQCRELGNRHCFCETDDLVVRLMYVERQRQVGGLCGPCEIGQSGSVCRADLDEIRTGLTHHIGYSEPASDLDQLTSAHGNPAARSQC